MDTEPSDNCQKDFLEMFNGGLASSPSVGRYCGNTLPVAWISQSNEARIEFHSDASDNRIYNGMRLQYSFISGGTIYNIYLYK